MCIDVTAHGITGAVVRKPDWRLLAAGGIPLVFLALVLVSNWQCDSFRARVDTWGTTALLGFAAATLIAAAIRDALRPTMAPLAGGIVAGALIQPTLAALFGLTCALLAISSIPARRRMVGLAICLFGVASGFLAQLALAATTVGVSVRCP